MESYFSDRFQRVEVGDTSSDWLRVVKGVPQGSLLGPFLNIFMNDIMYTSFYSYVSSYADDIHLFQTGFDAIAIKVSREYRLILFQPPSGLRPTSCVYTRIKFKATISSKGLFWGFGANCEQSDW